MAKITVVLDTETKEFSANIDGEMIENVDHVSISPPSKDYEYYSVCIRQGEKLESGLFKHTELRGWGSQKFEESTEVALSKSIASFLLPQPKTS